MSKTEEKPNSYEISDDLLNLLEKEHPDSLPDFEPSAFELGKMVGAKEVIEKIKLLVKSPEIEQFLEEINNV